MMLVEFLRGEIRKIPTDIRRCSEVFRNRGEIDTEVEHSLWGSVALEFHNNYADRTKNIRTHGAPVFDLLGSESEDDDRHRNWLDPVSVLDTAGGG